MNSPLLLIGASVRAAAQSARRAGFEPWAIDLFGDRDLREIATCRISQDYPTDIPALAEEFGDAPFLYAGAIENFPTVLTELCRYRTLWGNDPSIIARVRDPFRLQTFLQESSLPVIPLRRNDDPPDDPANWLVKAYLSGHGFGIAFASGKPIGGSNYYQRLLEGKPIGAALIANGTECRLIGIHQQLVGLPQDSSQPFQFHGAVAPAGLAAEFSRSVAEIGAALTRRMGLTGLFGCDFIVNSAGLFLLEVNPRYTASMELWEHHFARSLVADHVRACRDGLLPEKFVPARDGVTMKWIVYAPESTIVPQSLEESVRNLRGCRLADLPEEGTSIDRGDPVCTMLVTAASQSELEVSWKAGIQSVQRSCGWENLPVETFDRSSFE